MDKNMISKNQFSQKLDLFLVTGSGRTTMSGVGRKYVTAELLKWTSQQRQKS